MVAFGGIVIAIGWIINSAAGTFDALFRRRVDRNRRRCDLCDLRRQCGQVVPGPPWTRGRLDRRRFRGRRGADGHADPRGHRGAWLCLGVLLVWFGSGRHRLCLGVVDASAVSGRDAERRGPQGHPNNAILFSAGDARDPGVLGPLRHVCACSASGLMATAQIALIARGFMSRTWFFLGSITT